MITYRARLDVADELALYLAGLLNAERRRRGTGRGRRALSTFKQAVLGLRWFRDRTAIPALARDNDISRATGYRYIDEVIEVLAAQAPDLHHALRQAKSDGATYLILDGKLFPCDRLTEKTTSVKGTPIDRWYSGKHHRQGGNIQALTTPDGFPIWVSPVEPGSVHDITAADHHALGALYWAASQLDLPTLADGGYQGTGAGVHTLIKRSKTGKGRPLSTDNHAYNQALRSLAAPANADSPSSPDAGAPSTTSQPAPAKSATSSKLHSSSPTTNTAKPTEITSMKTFPFFPPALRGRIVSTCGAVASRPPQNSRNSSPQAPNNFGNLRGPDLDPTAPHGSDWPMSKGRGRKEMCN